MRGMKWLVLFARRSTDPQLQTERKNKNLVGTDEQESFENNSYEKVLFVDSAKMIHKTALAH